MSRGIRSFARGPLFTVVCMLGFCYRIYQSSASSNRWSWPIFFGTMGGVFGMIALFLIAGAVVFNGPHNAMGPSLIALAVAYVTLLIAVICYSNRAYKRLLAKRGLKPQLGF